MIARGQFNENEPEGDSGRPRRGRFDADAFYAALDAERRSRRYTWKQVAEEARVSASTLTRMAQGRRPDVDSLAALVAWAGLSADAFVDSGEVRATPGALTMISTYLKGDPQLSAEAAEALDQMVKAAYERMRNPG
jgi:transcriptional regulator with XRE-family HTH domain